MRAELVGKGHSKQHKEERSNTENEAAYKGRWWAISTIQTLLWIIIRRGAWCDQRIAFLEGAVIRLWEKRRMFQQKDSTHRQVQISTTLSMIADVIRDTISDSIRNIHHTIRLSIAQSID